MKFLFDILIIEDSKDDAQLVELFLRRAGIDGNFKVVEEKQEFIKQIHSKKYDIIIADYSLPHFGYLEAQSICRSEQVSTPVILVTGAIPANEEEMVHQSKPDAIVLKDGLQTLPAVVMNVVMDSKLRRDTRGVKCDVRPGVLS